MSLNESLGLLVTFVVALLGWLFAAYQTRENRRIQQQDHQRQLREKKVERILAYLEEVADLTYLYRMLANATDRLITDAEGRPLLDESGNYQVDKRSLFPDADFDAALKELEGKDTRNYIHLQALQIHRRQGEIGDLISDLDPSGQTRTEFGRLYLATVQRLSRLSDGEDFWAFVEALEEADSLRLALRKRIQDLAEQPKAKG